jgi:molecular chaperone GrpE
MEEERSTPPAPSAEEVPPAAPAPEPAPETAAPAPPPPEPQPDWETRFKYLLADFENFRRRSDRERDGIRTRERAEVLRGLLPIHDALDRARHTIAKAPKNDPVRKGMDMVARELDAFFERSGVQPVAVVGKPFDAAEHEAVVEAPPTPKAPDGTVREIVQQGYRFPGGLLRTAKVVVARTPHEAPHMADAPAAAGTAEGEDEARDAGPNRKE